MRARDALTVDLFDGYFPVPVERGNKPGSLDIDSEFRNLLSDLIKASALSRHQIAARMSELVGHEITKHQLDSWTAESRDGWRFPVVYLPAFEAAIESHELTAFIASLRGAKLYIGKEALMAQLGKLEAAKDQLRRQEVALKRLLGD
ncbi:hypothetical protein ACQE3E_15480 [Methylomonas sp. MED-D]|uniref:hypothetical protein n=2 Tax=unclassified Methylomonas TaxID=2608980 RepID=UPI003D0306A5